MDHFGKMKNGVQTDCKIRSCSAVRNGLVSHMGGLAHSARDETILGVNVDGFGNHSRVNVTFERWVSNRALRRLQYVVLERTRAVCDGYALQLKAMKEPIVVGVHVLSSLEQQHATWLLWRSRVVQVHLGSVELRKKGPRNPSFLLRNTRRVKK